MSRYDKVRFLRDGKDWKIYHGGVYVDSVPIDMPVACIRQIVRDWQDRQNEREMGRDFTR